MASAIGGTGTVTVTGGGTVTLSGANTYSGGTIIAAGTLQIDNGGSLGTGSVTDDANLALDFTGTLASAIGGTGTVTMTGGGTVTLSGASTFSGGTTISAGTLKVGSYDALGTGPVTLNDVHTGASNTALLATIPTSAGSPIPNNINVADLGTGTSTLGTTAFSDADTTTFLGNVALDKSVTFQGGNWEGGTTWDGVISSPDGPVDVQVITASGVTALSGTPGAPTTFAASGNTFTGNLNVVGSGTILQSGEPLAPVSGFGGNGSGWTVTSSGLTSAAVTGDVLTLTDGNYNEGRSAFDDTPVPTTDNFVASFTYTATSPNFPYYGADGMAFVLQDSAAGAHALGATRRQPGRRRYQRPRTGTHLQPLRAQRHRRRLLLDCQWHLDPGDAVPVGRLGRPHQRQPQERRHHLQRRRTDPHRAVDRYGHPRDTRPSRIPAST